MRQLPLAFLLVLAACGGGVDSTTAVAADEPATTAVSTTVGSVLATTSSAAPPATAISTTTEAPDFTIFVASLVETLSETSYADAVLTDADVFVATGQLMCELLDEGIMVDDVLVEFLDELEVEGTTPEDEVFVVGATLGVAIESICPHHRDALE